MRAAIRISCLCLFINLPAYAGELGDYEGGVSNPPPEDKQPPPSQGSGSVRIHSSDDDDCCSFFDFVREIFSEGTRNSVQRMFSGSRDSTLQPRQIGDALLPLLRYDNYFSYMNANQYSIDQRLELGWGPIGFEYRRTNFTQYTPASKLQWEQRNFLYRLAFGNHVGINYGVSNSILSGSTVNYGSNGVFQFFIHSQRYGFEYRSVGTSFESGAFSSDDDFTLMLHTAMGSLSVGYRRLAIPGNDLSGYYVGYSLRL